MSKQHKRTQNNRGYMHPLSAIAKQFIAFAAHSKKPVIDMGCAYGIASIAALEAGTHEVIACDIDQAHLNILKQHITDPALQARLIAQRGEFPQDFNFNENSIGAVLLAHILPYLDKPSLDQGLQKLYGWLEPGGKLFILCYSIHIRELAHPKFITEYQRRLDENMDWPGYLENFYDYSYLPDDEEENPPFPMTLHFFDIEILSAALEKIGFAIELADYLDGKANGAVSETWHDGREYVGVIARKPSPLKEIVLEQQRQGG